MSHVTLRRDDYLKLVQYIYTTTGILLSDNRYEKLRNRIEDLIMLSGFPSFRAFFRDLRFNRQTKNMQKLINTVTINETYFYREKHQFQTLLNGVLPKIVQRKQSDDNIRILCAPSSTGEEPYSIVLHLLEDNDLMHKTDYEIMGIDIDNEAIEHAKKGIYKKRSVQNLPFRLLRSFFTPIGLERFELKNHIKDSVIFQVSNVMKQDSLEKLGHFDVIFSRNMLIYFDEQSKKQVLENFYHLLKPGAYVFLGHAENISKTTSLFSTLKIGESIVYQKQFEKE